MTEYRCDKCGYFLLSTPQSAPVVVKVVCRNCRKHQYLDLSKPPVAPFRERALVA